MSASTQTLRPGADDRVSSSATHERRLTLALAVVAVGYFCLTVFLVGVHFSLSHDETTYLSQVNPSVPNFEWNAWRAWGMPALFAPVAVFSPGLGAVRLYASVLTSVALFVGFWPWIKTLRSAVVPLAALLFCTFWVAIYYGNDVQPNLYVAFGAVGAVGFFLRAVKEPQRTWLPYALGLLLFIVALVRPSDAILVAAPLGFSALFVRQLRRPILAVPISAGVIAGWMPWLVESFTRFGNPINRYHLSNAHDAVGGLHLNIHTTDIYLRLLDGPFYGYRNNLSAAGGIPRYWVVALVIAAVVFAVGLYAARRTGTLAAMSLVVAAMALLTLFYVFLLGYGATRFLLPIVALATLPIANGLVWLMRRRPRPVMVVGVITALVLVATNLSLQLATANTILRNDRAGRVIFLQIGVGLRHLGVTKPCIIFGSVDPTPTAYWARCQAGPESTAPGSLGAPLEADVQHQVAKGMTVVVVTRASRLGSYFSTWTKVSVPGVDDKRVHAWISPNVHVPRH